jgi:Protein of unknown function (DUF3224)
MSGNPRQEENAMSATAGSDRTHATGAISVKVWDPQPYDRPSDGPALVKIHVEEEISGDIEGSGVVEFLQAERADGSASFVGIERVTGSIRGRAGTFLLQDQGTLEGGTVSGTWFVVPESGTGELAGVRGEGGFTAQLGQGADITLDYWFD